MIQLTFSPKKIRIMKKYIPLIALLSAALACSRTADDHEHAHDEMPIGPVNDTTVVLAPAQVQIGGIALGQFEKMDIAPSLTASGTLVVHPEHMAILSAFTNGTVEYLAPVLNKRVQRGQTLARLRKIELLDLQEQYLSLQQQLPFLQAEYERYKLLSEQSASARKLFEKATADYNTAKTNLEVLAAKLKSYGISPEELSPDKLQTTIALRAPIDGLVTHIHTSLGASVQPGDALMEIQNLDELHADLWIYEKDLPRVKTGQQVTLHLPSLREQPLKGRIYSIDKALDPERKALRAHVELLSKPEAAVNGMFVQGAISSDKPMLADVLPEGAVAREGDIDVIFYKKGENQSGVVFVRVPVRVLARFDGKVAVEPLEPVPAGVPLVTHGAYYISATTSMAGAEHEH